MNQTLNEVILEENLLPSALAMFSDSEDRSMLHKGAPDQDPAQSPDLNPLRTSEPEDDGWP